MPTTEETDKLKKARDKATVDVEARGLARAEELRNAAAAEKKTTEEATSATIPEKVVESTKEQNTLEEARKKATALVQERGTARAKELIDASNSLSTNSSSTNSSSTNNSSVNSSSVNSSSVNSSSTNSSSTNNSSVNSSSTNNSSVNSSSTKSSSNTVISSNSQSTNTLSNSAANDPYKGIMLMNIGGEIVNLEGRSNNSGRISLDQFKTRYTDDNNDIILLKKVFGIPTLRHTPTLLTKDGCSLDEKEAATIRKILEKRKRDLERGASFSKGLTLDSTRQKIRNLEILLKRIEELIGVAKEPCEPSKLSAIGMPSITIPSLSMPKLLAKRDDSTEKLLILILILLLGVASDKVRSKNIKDRLGSDTIEGIIKAVQTKSLKTKNITTLLEKVTDGLSGSMISPDITTIKATNAVAAISDPTLKASYESLIGEFDELKDNFNKLSTEKATIEGELAGKAAAIKVLETHLEEEKTKSSRMVEEAANSLNRPVGTEENIEASRKQKQLFEEQIHKLEDERLQANAKLQDITEKFGRLVKIVKEHHTAIIAKKAEVEAAFAAKESEHQETLLQKQQILDEREILRATLKAKNESSAVVTAEIGSLREELRKTSEELEARRRENAEAIAGLEAMAAAEPDDNTTVTSVSSASVAEETKIKGVLEALRAIYDKTHDDELLTQIEKLEGSLEVMKTVINENEDESDEVFSSKLKSLLVQLALIDEQSEEVSLSIEPQELLEPVRERLCLLYYFSAMHWKLVKDRIDSVIQTQQSNPGFSGKYAKEFIQTIDETFLPNLKDSEIWSTAAIIGKVIAALAKEKGVIPSEARDIIQKLSKADEEQKAKSASNYRQTLVTIRTGTNNILPKGDTYIDPGTFEIKQKTPRQFSILETTYLYILELKLLSRYVNYILMNSPHKLECQALQLIEQS